MRSPRVCPPTQLQRTVGCSWCARSPRAGSTAQCAIARGVLDLIGYGEKSAGRSFSSLLHENQVDVDYWNFHLHTLCSDGVDCVQVPFSSTQGCD